MHRVGKRAFLALGVSFSLVTFNSSKAVTIATFADPSDGTVPLFTVDVLGETISGLWSNPGLTLETFAGTFSDVRFSMPTLGFDADFNTGPGAFEFRDILNNLLLRVDFDGGHLENPFSFGATEFLSLGDVSFSGPVVDPPGIEDGTESFAFGFANQQQTASGYTATAAFTSSGTPIPEPSTLLALGAMTAAAIYRRKR